MLGSHTVPHRLDGNVFRHYHSDIASYQREFCNLYSRWQRSRHQDIPIHLKQRCGIGQAKLLTPMWMKFSKIACDSFTQADLGRFAWMQSRMRCHSEIYHCWPEKRLNVCFCIKKIYPLRGRSILLGRGISIAKSSQLLRSRVSFVFFPEATATLKYRQSGLLFATIRLKV